MSTKSRQALAQISNILENVYGVGMTVASPATVLWAADRCDNPEDALVAINRIRKKHGAPLVSVWDLPHLNQFADVL